MSAGRPSARRVGLLALFLGAGCGALPEPSPPDAAWIFPPPVDAGLPAPDAGEADAGPSDASAIPTEPAEPPLAPSEDEVIDGAEREASLEGRAVLEAGRRYVEARTRFRGGCWSFADATYRRAGFPPGRRLSLWRKKHKGPYAPASLFQPGDWLYYINHQYRRVPHSAIFVGWVDRVRRRALMVSYAGGRRREPPRYSVYDLRHVYGVTRPAPAGEIGADPPSSEARRGPVAKKPVAKKKAAPKK